MCVHGVGVSSRYFVPTMRSLAERAPDLDVWSPDLPGFGRSEKPDSVLDVDGLADALLAVCDAAGLDRPVLLANSFGCQVVATAAVQQPGAVGSLVLVGPTGDPRTGFAELAGRWLLNAPRESPTQVPLLLLDYLEAGSHRVLRTALEGARHPMESTLAGVGHPTLVVRGEHDRIVTQPWAEHVTRVLSHGRLVLIPGSAHTVNYTHPERLADAVLHFIDVTGAGAR